VTSTATDRVSRTRDALRVALDAAPAADLSFLPQPPDDDGWAGAPDLLRFLHALVLALHPRHVLEFGSGVSTAVLAHAAAALGDCAVTSVDHDPRFVNETSDLLDPSGPVALQLAPLVARVHAGRLGPAYLVDSGLFASSRPADLVLVDGPPAVLGGRATMLPVALDYAQCGSIVLFDDAERDGERDALEAWECVLGDAVEVHRPAGFARGLAALILVAPRTAQIRLQPRKP
jgi:predicted O-methyltransferase YrrM